MSYLRRVEGKVDEALLLLRALVAAYLGTQKDLNTMSAELDALTAEVAATKTIEESAVKALAGIKAQLDAALASADPPAALKSLSDSLGSSNADLAAAIAAVSPPAPSPAPAPVPPAAA